MLMQSQHSKRRKQRANDVTRLVKKGARQKAKCSAVALVWFVSDTVKMKSPPPRSHSKDRLLPSGM